MSLSKKYVDLEVQGDGPNKLCIEVSYDLGGHNYFTGKYEPRGYYLRCTPCVISNTQTCNGTSYKTISISSDKPGMKMLLKEVSRQSKKSEQDALLRAEEKEDWLIGKVCESQRLKLKE